MIIETIILVLLLSFILQFFDASVGQGFGTLTPLLLILGFALLEVVPAVIFASAVLSLITGLIHHGFSNVNFNLKGRSFRITAILILFGSLGIIMGAVSAINIPEIILRAYIGLLVIAIGLSVLLKVKTKHEFQWRKIIGLGLLASFNKGISGGGYGPVLASGQVLSGVKSKKAVGMTAMSEGVVSFAGIAAYIFADGFKHINIELISALIAGGLIATPIAAYVTKKAHPRKLKLAIGLISIILGMIILLQLLV